MGCFLGCFGASKDDKKRHKITHNVNISSRPTSNVANQYNAVPQTVVAVKQDYVEKPINFPVPEPRAELEKVQLNFTDHRKQEKQLGTRKRVTFHSSVKEYEHVSEVPEIIQENEQGPEQGVDAGRMKPAKSSSVSESGSSLSSAGSFPPNHRYQNCIESDDEDDELDCEVSDLDEDEDGHGDDDEEAYDAAYSDDEYYSRRVPDFSTKSCSSMESGTKRLMSPVSKDRHDVVIKDHGSVDKEERTPPGIYRGARDRAGYVHSVLNPIENIAQWRNVKSKQTVLLKQPKENFPMDLGFKQPSLKSKAAVDETEKNQEIAVDASLSTWLFSSQKTPRSKGSTFGLEPICSGASISSHGSNSVQSHEERPILGTLTMEELKQFSASSSPRKSPSRSPDEKPLVGTVGIHWNNRNEMTPVENSGSASSFKGIPNTTSKYREDKRVKWHSTPFETRLERALNRSATDSCT